MSFGVAVRDSGLTGGRRAPYVQWYAIDQNGDGGDNLVRYAC